MQLFALLIVFPPEIVNMIHIHLKKSTTIEKISSFLEKCQDNINVITFSLRNIIWSDSSIISRQICLCSSRHIEALGYILENYYSPAKYRDEFWRHYLNYLGNLLMNEYNRLWYYNQDSNCQEEYCNYKKAVDYWFKLCKKHNLYLRIETKSRPNNISAGDTTISYVNAREIKPIKTFYNMSTCPNIMDRYDPNYPELNYIYHDSSYLYLCLFLRIDIDIYNMEST